MLSQSRAVCAWPGSGHLNNRGFCKLFTNSAAQHAFGCGGGHPACSSSLCHIVPCGPDLIGTPDAGACWFARKGKKDKPVDKYPNCVQDDDDSKQAAASALVPGGQEADVDWEEPPHDDILSASINSTKRR